MENLLKKHIRDWWLILAMVASPPACVGIWASFFDGSMAARLIYYYVVFAVATALPFVDRLVTGWSWNWKLSTYVPTVAAMVRMVVAALLGLTLIFRSEMWVNVVTFSYLGFYSFFALNYSLAWYHARDTRWLRVFFDLVFATLLVFAFDPLRYASWLTFLLPIIIVARAYRAKLAFLITALATVLTAVSIFWHGGVFSRFGDESNYVLAMLVIIVVSFVAPPVIYFDERRNRLGAVQYFGRCLWLALKRNPRITPQLLSFLTHYTNSELVIAVSSDAQCGDSMHCWHTASSPLRAKGGIFDNGTLRRYRVWKADFDNVASLPETVPSMVAANVSRLARTMRRSTGVPAKLWQDLGCIDPEALTTGFTELHARNSNGALHHFATWVREARIIDDCEQLEGTVLEGREADPLYRDFKVISLVGISIPEWDIYFVNNFPNKFKRVPRAFWTDGIEKIQLAKMLLERKTL